MTIFSSGVFNGRMNDDYFSNLKEYAKDTGSVIKKVTNDDPFWRRD